MHTRMHHAVIIAMLNFVAVNISCSNKSPSIATIETMHTELLSRQMIYIQKAESIQISNQLRTNLESGRTVCYFNQNSLEADKQSFSKAVSSIRDVINEKTNRDNEANLSAEYISRVHSGFQYQQQQVSNWISEIEQNIINPEQGTDKIKSAMDGLEIADKRHLLLLYINMLNYLKEAEGITAKYNKSEFNPRRSPRT